MPLHANTIHTQFDYRRISFFLTSFSLFLFSFLLQGSLFLSLSFPPTHTQQLIRFINSYHRFIIRINYVSLPWSFASIRLPPFPFSAIPHIRLLVQKLRQSLFSFILFLLSFSFLLVSRFIAIAVNSSEITIHYARERVGWRNTLPRGLVFFLGPALPSLSHNSLITSFLFTRARRSSTHQKTRFTHINIVASTITVDNSLKSDAMPINFHKSTRRRSMLRKDRPDELHGRRRTHVQ